MKMKIIYVLNFEEAFKNKLRLVKNVLMISKKTAMVKPENSFCGGEDLKVLLSFRVCLINHHMLFKYLAREKKTWVIYSSYHGKSFHGISESIAFWKRNLKQDWHGKINQTKLKTAQNCDQYSEFSFRKSSLIPLKYLIGLLAFSFAVFCRGRTTLANSNKIHLLLN